MPALFAYVIAVGILLGAGYGTLNWLAAPEPVKVVAGAKPRPVPPHYPDAAVAELSQVARAAPDRSEGSTVGANGSGHGEAESSDRSALMAANQTPPDPTEVAETAAKAEASPPQTQQNSSAHVEASPPDDKPEAGQRVEPSPSEVKPKADRSRANNRANRKEAQSNRSVAAVSAGQAPATESPSVAATPGTLTHSRRASRQSGRPLTLMTLRTIEFADGRRVSQLVPYRSGDRYSAFDSDD